MKMVLDFPDKHHDFQFRVTFLLKKINSVEAQVIVNQKKDIFKTAAQDWGDCRTRLG
jgi:hypothetical protein